MSFIKPPSLPPLYNKKSPRPKNTNEKYLVDLDQFNIIQNNFKKGSLGIVNLVCYKKNKEILASKTSYIQINDQNKPFISREIRSLISIQHPTLIPYRGFSYTDFNGQNKITVLMNYIKSISLSEMLDNNILSSSSFDNTKRQIILVGIARSMMILHKHHILHQDLKAENILLDKYYQPVITDFGLTKIFNPKNSPIQSNPYLAPEIISGSKFNSKSDVYSFGILMYEILTGKRLKNSIQNTEGMMITSNLSTTKKGLKTIIEKCLSKSQIERPTFSELFRKLSLLQFDSEEKDVINENDDNCEFGSLEFCLEKVDLEKLFAYVEKIIEETPFDKMKNERKMINEEMQVLKIHNRQMARKIAALEKENEQLKNEINFLKNGNINTNSNDSKKQTMKSLRDSQQEKINDIEKQTMKSSQDSQQEKVNDSKKQTIKSISSRKKQQLEEAMQIANEALKNQKDEEIEDNNQKNEIETQEVKSLTQEKEEQKSDKETNHIKDNISNEEFQNNQSKQTENYLHDQIERINYISIENDQNKEEESQLEIQKEPTKIIEDTSFFNSIDDLEKFNNLDGESQLSQIQQMQSSMSHQTYDKMVNLLTYLSNETHEPNDKSIIFILPNITTENDQKKESDPIIGISSNTTEILFKNGSLESSELSEQIDHFGEIYIEISYPSPEFKDIYRNVIKMRKNHQKNLKISILINSQSTDQQFRGNIEINCVRFDPKVEKITSLGYNGSFEGCTSLSRVVISSSTKSIGSYAFKDCLSLLSVKIPSSVVSIDNWSFSNCESLQFFSIPSSVKHVGSNCFNGCKSLNCIDFSASLNSIEYGSFFDCSSISFVEIPSSVKVIESNAFERCFNLKKVVIPDSVNEIEYNAFCDCCSLNCISIPDSVEKIGHAAFKGCSMLDEIIIPKNLDSIQHHCFAYCKSLKKVTLKSKIEYIGYNAFDGCSSLCEFEVPSSVKAIGFDAFTNCSSLMKITIPSSINWYPIGIGYNVEVIVI